MGIIDLWTTISNADRSFLIAEIAEEHYAQHGRPLRVAVDEADWRFNNLTREQVYTIQVASNQPYQGIEKSMFYRICRLLTFNYQLMFVFDGPRRPAKRGRNGGTKIDYESRRLLKELLRHFKIPYHEAPGEAEAECARLQQLGIVDAVFSQDSDSLMFGCDYLIRDDRIGRSQAANNDHSKENTKKSSKSFRVVRGQELRNKYSLDQDGLVLYAMLVGGDYNTKGLPGCGSRLALRAVQAGLGRSLRLCRSQRDCSAWRQVLAEFLLQAPRSGHIEVPSTFPEYKILVKYRDPTVSSDDQLRALRGLQRGWDSLPDERKLLRLTSERFNMWGRLYLNWVAPVLLTKSIIAGNLPSDSSDLLDIKMVQTRQKKVDGQPLMTPLDRKLSFNTFKVTKFKPQDFEGSGEDYDQWRAYPWENPIKNPCDPEHRTECEMPLFLLRKILPPEVLDPPPKTKTKATQKRTRAADVDDVSLDHDTQLPPKRSKTSTRNLPDAGEQSRMTSQSKRMKVDTPLTQDTQAMHRFASPRRSVRVSAASSSQGHCLPVDRSLTDAASSDVTFSTTNPSRSVGESLLPNLEYSDFDDDEEIQFQMAVQLSLQNRSSAYVAPESARSARKPLLNFEASDSGSSMSIPREDPLLKDDLRAARLRHFANPSNFTDKTLTTNASGSTRAFHQAHRSTPDSEDIECIDLTGD